MVGPIGNPFGGSGGGNIDNLFSQEEKLPPEIARIKALVQGPPPRRAKNAELNFTYGDVIRAQNEDGDRFELRMDRKKGAEFAKDFDRIDPEARLRQGGADTAAFSTETFQFDLEAYDVARTLYNLFQVAEGNVDVREINDNPEFNKLDLVSRDKVLEELGFDPKRSFKINGVKFRLDGDRFTKLSAGGDIGAESAEEAEVSRRLDKVRSRLSQSQSSGVLDSKFLLDRREGLLQDFKYAYFDIGSLNYQGTDSFRDVVAAGTVFADAVFFGMSVGFQIAEDSGAPQGLRQEVGLQIASHVSNDVFSTVLALPPSEPDTLFRKIEETIDAYDKTFNIDTSFESTLDSSLQRALQNLDAAFARASETGDPTQIRSLLGATFRNGVYTVPKYTLF